MLLAPETRRVWLYPIVVLGGAALAWFALLLYTDAAFFGESTSWVTALTRIFGPAQTAATLQNTLGSLPEVVVAILGIAITVVSIIVQLSATRYTPRVTEMFFRDRTNLIVLSFFVITSIHCIWTAFSVRKAFVPNVLALSALVMITVAILLLIPYFTYVFAFLDPERVVARLQQQALAHSTHTAARDAEQAQQRVLDGIEQLADVAVNAISQKDRLIASRAVDALRDLSVRYMQSKSQLPLAWFEIGAVLRRNPDFVVMSQQSTEEIGRTRSWLEWKVLRQYQTIYGESINRMRDISELIAINTRYIGEAAATQNETAVTDLTIRFFNTYLRSTINHKDVRSAYNALHQYRQLAEYYAHAQDAERTLALAVHLQYYGQVANAAGLSFVTETVAHDLSQLCEVAHSASLTNEREILAVFLEVDKAPETASEELSLRGVRKAQIKLATFYLELELEELARIIWSDMKHERPERLQSIRTELLAVKERTFWEIVDRGYNFDYLEPDRRAQLDRFFGWFTA